jgi:serpin B
VRGARWTAWLWIVSACTSGGTADRAVGTDSKQGSPVAATAPIERLAEQAAPPAVPEPPVPPAAEPSDEQLSAIALEHEEKAVAGASTLPPTMVSQLNAVALRMLAELAPERTNLVIAPAEAALAAQLLLAGARAETAAEIQHAFGLTSAQGALLAKELKRLSGGAGAASGLTLLSALFSDAAPLAGYVRHARDDLHAQVVHVSFADREAARTEINQALTSATNGKLVEACPRGCLGSDAPMVVVSVAALSAPWQSPFDAARTQPRAFHRRARGDLQTPFMERQGEVSLGMLGEDTTVLELPYAGGELALDVILPGPDGTPREAFDADTLGRTLERLEPSRVQLRVPRLSLSLPGVGSRSFLHALGVKRVFGPQADLSGIAGKPGQSWLAELRQVAALELSEPGAPGAAVENAAQPEGAPLVAIDRPFLFLVRALKSGLIVLAGRVGDPSGNP